MTDRPLGTTPEPPAPSPEPWKEALAERLRDASMDAWIPLSEALALISKHHDPSCPGPTPMRTERDLVAAARSLLAVVFWSDNGTCSICHGFWPKEHREHCQGARLRKALEVKP